MRPVYEVRSDDFPTMERERVEEALPVGDVFREMIGSGEVHRPVFFL
jgi:hypothetical protein